MTGIRKHAATGLALAALAAVAAAADFSGTVVGIRGNQWDAPGPLVAVDVPSYAKRDLAGGECMGPCFSPNGSRIAFVRDGELFTIGINGQELASTGIRIPQGVFQSAVAVYWLSVGGREYFYWARTNMYWGSGEEGNGPEGLFRAAVGTTTVEHLIDGPYTWAGFSQDGSRAVAMHKEYYMVRINMATKAITRYTPPEPTNNCNGSISPNGLLFASLLGPGSWSDKDEGCLWIKNWDGSGQNRIVCSDCYWGAPRWSHASNDIIVGSVRLDPKQRNECPGLFTDSYTICAGMLYNATTGEKLRMPPIGIYFSPYDYYPSRLLTADTSAAPPDFDPNVSWLETSPATIAISTATTGASMRYTLDGSTPTESNGTLISSSRGSVRISLSGTQSVRLQAVAFKSGLRTSVVSSKWYWRQTPPFTVKTPQAGQRYAIGDTLLVEWNRLTPEDEQGVSVRLSLDSGDVWTTLNSRSIIPTDPNVGSYRWPIAPQLGGRSTVTTRALVRIEKYGVPSIYAQSGAFTITETPSGAALPAVRCHLPPHVSLVTDGRAIRLSGARWACVVRVLDGRGRVVHTVKLPGGGRATLDPGTVPGGLYLIAVDGDAVAGIPVVLR